MFDSFQRATSRLGPAEWRLLETLPRDDLLRLGDEKDYYLRVPGSSPAERPGPSST